ncbi:JmjC domain-containing protein [Fusarium falciforme]|uniref:JmjC domain-containing protein n=1 Tax=Fusarium falciforme TaxID=195108 RepID=UPI002300F848|nr:JmjC domain-containing protein [Fusarium falciforme]WAO86060.1 JmjC domain-containing protein [Fusarium falciforme]
MANKGTGMPMSQGTTTSCGPSPAISTLCPLPSNPSSTDPELPFSRSIKRPSHEPNVSTDYNSEVQDHPEVVTDGERETNARLTSRYVDPEDHPAYKELQTRIHQSRNDQDRWKACVIFHERYKILKELLGKLGEEIEEKRRQLEEAEASRGDKESNLDALVLLGTSFMRLECERFGQVLRSYNEARHKRPRSSDYSEQRDLQASGQEWSDFFDNHTKASRDLQKCEKALDCIGKTWGDDKIRYYGWATKTWATCRVLQRAAKAVPTWEEAGIKLNRLRNYRDRVCPFEEACISLGNHMVGDEEYGLALPADGNRRQRRKSSMADATTQTDPMLGEEFNLAKARDLSSSSQGAELSRYCNNFQDSEEFKRRALEELNEVGDKSCWGAESSSSCSHYLSRSCCPAVEPSNGQLDAYFSTLDEAKGLVDRMTPAVPIFTRRSNASGWKPNLRPIVDYLTRMKTVRTKKRYVQKYSLEMAGESFTKVTQWEVMSHFLREDGADGLDLWNALELENHLEQRHVPEFLTNSNCNLLVEMRKRAGEKRVVKKGRKAKKVEDPPEKDPLHFALIADGGMNTYPHTDSHGYSTFLTVQEGELIFGWLSGPDDDTWNEWARNPRYFGGGRWCFVVMKPGDSVYLPSGTPHYVVRRKGTQTFILGGHVLQWSNLHGWASLLRRQIDNPTTTNEHMASETVRRYVEIAGGLVAEAMKSGDDRLEYLGGIEAAEQTRQVLKDLQEMIENKKTQTET